MRRRVLLLIPLCLAACDMGTYTPGARHGGEDASVGSHLSSVDSGGTDAAGASTAINGHFYGGTGTGGGR